MIKNFKQATCPVCGKYTFVDDLEIEKSEPDYKGKEDDYCIICGWRYDRDQLDNHDLSYGLNVLSVNDYIKDYEKKIAINPNYNYLEDNYIPTPHICPVCGEYTFPDKGSFDVCPVCGWEDDELMELEPDKWAGCANDLCLNDYKKRYIENKK
ncbi:MAG: CPCC family cysteine-rich protein [Erysipelotrichaceae bacterium]|nr:CPCC family cysteine-rich protein [Erysipelotrichaceae bacterium]